MRYFIKRTLEQMTLLQGLGLFLALIFTTPAGAQTSLSSDWPCKQVRVAEMSLSGVMSHPELPAEKKTWRDKADIADLVARLSARRTPLSEAEKLIDEFKKNSGALRKERMSLLFNATFDVMNDERREVVNGLDRFGRRLKEMAERIRDETQSTRALQDRKPPDLEEIKKASETLQWRLRLFEEQRRMATFVCESPALIEQRFGALARAIITRID
jgi:hypothetical protein